MTLSVLSCGIFRPEIERLMPDIMREIHSELRVSFVPPALHVDYRKLADGIAEGFRRMDRRNEEKVLLLYGSMCHPKLPDIAEDAAAAYIKPGNCIDAVLSKQRKDEIEAKYGRVFYLTAGWLKYWRDIFQGGMGWDSVDARTNMGFYDQIIVLDSGITRITDEDVIEFFEFTQVPVDVEPITLDYFKSVLLDICLELKNQEG
ncbi:hypothetical protein FACS1894216_12390 [Synergistales bacterium]|nr:hypothetical protein FACS1894216_12390 [Synergistales bacterium]